MMSSEDGCPDCANLVLVVQPPIPLLEPFEGFTDGERLSPVGSPGCLPRELAGWSWPVKWLAQPVRNGYRPRVVMDLFDLI
jgi:hypothetical protein